MTGTEAVILCEGYHDPAFWAAWLTQLGCKDRRASGEGRTAKGDVCTPSGESITKGKYGFDSPSGTCVLVVPCHGRREIMGAMLLRLRGLITHPFQHLVLSIDDDTDASQDTQTRVGNCLTSVRQVIPDAGLNSDKTAITLPDGETMIHLLRWATDETETPNGVPTKQTLERLVCSAIIAAHPERGPAVQAWLDARPGPDGFGPKNFAWSHMAGWYSERGCENFYAAVWEDPAIVENLKRHLTASGAWRIAETIAGI